jgi:hypothetical protein
MLKLKLCALIVILGIFTGACVPVKDTLEQIYSDKLATEDVCRNTSVLDKLKIYYMANLEDGTLYVNTINGDNEQPVWQVKNLKNFDVSPNGERVLGRIADGNEESWVLGDLGASELVRLGYVEEYAWSPDGDALIYFDEDAQELFMIRQGEFSSTSLVAIREFVGAETLSVSWPTWSSTRKKAVVFISAYKAAVIVDGFIREEKVGSKVILIDTEINDIKTVFEPDNDIVLLGTGWVPDGSKFHVLFIRDNPEPKYGFMFQIYDHNGYSLGRAQHGVIQTSDYSGNNWAFSDFRDHVTYTIDIPTLIGNRDKVIPTGIFPYDGWLGENSFYSISREYGHHSPSENSYTAYRISLTTGSNYWSQSNQKTGPLLSLSSPKIAPSHRWFLTFSNPHLDYDENTGPRKTSTALWVVDSATDEIFRINVETPEPYFDPEVLRRSSIYFPDRFEGEFSSDSRYYVFYSIDQAFENTLYVYDHCTRLISMPGLKVDLPEVQVVKLEQGFEDEKLMQGKFDIIWSTR